MISAPIDRHDDDERGRGGCRPARPAPVAEAAEEEEVGEERDQRQQRQRDVGADDADADGDRGDDDDAPAGGEIAEFMHRFVVLPSSSRRGLVEHRRRPLPSPIPSRRPAGSSVAARRRAIAPPAARRPPRPAAPAPSAARCAAGSGRARTATSRRGARRRRAVPRSTSRWPRQPRDHHRHRALVRPGPLGQLVERQPRRLGERLQHEQLRAAQPGALLGRARRLAQRLHDAADGVEHRRGSPARCIGSHISSKSSRWIGRGGQAPGSAPRTLLLGRSRGSPGGRGRRTASRRRRPPRRAARGPAACRGSRRARRGG